MAQINKPTDYFNTVLYTGNSSTQSITGVGFQPDWVWCKSRSGADNHAIFDAVRGGQKQLRSNTTDAELTRTNAISSFDSDGWSMGSQPEMNSNTVTYASWNWLASNTTASNTDGSITSTVSANTTSGFSIVSYTGTGANATIGHGLGSLPGMVIVKGRNTTSTNHWFVFHQNSQSSYSASGSAILLLNAINAVDTIGVGGVWNNTSPTSSVFNIGTENGVNESGKDFIAYCFAEKKGFSKFGSYTGNGSTDGPMVYLGFKPSYLLIKHYNGAGNEWEIYDNKRIGYNSANYHLNAHDSTAEATLSNRIDFLSNGFKLRAGPSGPINTTGNNYIYMAFAESPLVGTNNTPATAR